MKREEKTKLTKEKIIAAAIKEFGSKGYAMASINNVCNAGIAKGLIYHNFESKDALYLECLRICFYEIVEGLSNAVDTDSYEDYIKVRNEIFDRNHSKTNMVLEALIHPPEIHRNEIAEIKKAYDEINLAFFEKILSSRNLRNGVDKDSAIQYFALVQNMFNWYYCNPGFGNQTLEDTVRMHEENLPKMLDYMLYGIIKDGDR